MSAPVSKKAKTVSTGMLLGMGNPLLDISTTCEPDFLEKYDLKPDNAILAEDKHIPLYKEMEANFKVDYIAGGATLNSIRIAQWILREPKAASYFGCIGDDEYGNKLNQKSEEAGINARFQVNSEHSTGTCAVLVNGDNRSMVANLAAANHFKPTHFDIKENWDVVEKAEYYYISGFFLTVSPDSIIKIADHACKAKSKVFTMNLSAPFICQFFGEPLMKCLQYVDILFGNETEAVTFAQAQNFGTEDIKEIALKTAALDKVNKDRPRMVIFTQGGDPTIIACEGKVTEHPIIPIDAKDMVDTNGAGDAFVGGFLSQYVVGQEIERCVDVGHQAANYIIKVSGCTLAAEPPSF